MLTGLSAAFRENGLLRMAAMDVAAIGTAVILWVVWSRRRQVESAVA
jgi:hypothetical protein